jgi:gas vesicle protein
MRNSNDNGKFIAGILTGMVAGVVLGILYAPDDGANTRKKIMEGIKGMGGNFGKKMKDDSGPGEVNDNSGHDGEEKMASTVNGQGGSVA